MRVSATVALLALGFALGCTKESKSPPPAPAAPPAPAPVAKVEAPAPPAYEAEWTPTSFGHYLMPHAAFPDGNVDLVFHFHAGRAAEKDFRESGSTPVIVVGTWGATTQAYSGPFADPKRFDKMITEVMRLLRERTGNQDLKLRRLSLFAWSAGFASVGRILREGYADRIDTVVLLDAPHTAYTDAPPKHPKPGAAVKRQMSLAMLDPYIRFAKEAAAGRKEFVMTHSSIVPIGYASTTECAGAFIDAVGATRVEDNIDAGNGFTQLYHADIGNFHVRGYSGETKEAHVAQIHLLTPVFHDYIVPRWRELDAPAVPSAIVRKE